MIRDVQHLIDEIPPSQEIETYLRDFFKTNLEHHYLADLNLIVAQHFGISEDAYMLTLIEADMPGHAKSNEQTVLDSRVGIVVSINLYEAGVVKRVAPNTYESIKGPDPEMTDSAGMRAARTRAGLSEILPSIKILRDGCGKSLEETEQILLNSTGTRFDPEMVKKAIKVAATLPANPYPPFVMKEVR